MDAHKHMSNYLKAPDITPEGQTMTVLKVVEEQVGRDQEKKLVVFFAENEKGLVMNKTNIQFLIDTVGGETDEWVGEEVVVYNDPAITFGSKTTGGLRIKAP